MENCQTNKDEKVMKKVKVNGVQISVELDKEESRKFPNKLESTIKVKDKEVEPISAGSIFF